MNGLNRGCDFRCTSTLFYPVFFVVFHGPLECSSVVNGVGWGSMRMDWSRSMMLPKSDCENKGNLSADQNNLLGAASEGCLRRGLGLHVNHDWFRDSHSQGRAGGERGRE